MHFELEAGRLISSTREEPITQDPPRSIIECRQEVPRLGTPESPALVPWKRGDAAAYELKFLLDSEKSRRVESLIAQHLACDPHGLAEFGNAYRITTVYCDTPEYDVFHGVGSYRRRKYRLRSYGAESRVYLERKTKFGQRVRKKRTSIEAVDLAPLSGFQSREEWPGSWFHRQLLDRRLNPVCCLSYLRTAYVGASAEGPIRATFDRDLSGFASTAWSPASAGDPIPFLAGRVVCEFKFRGSLPDPFKSVIHSLQLTPCGNSKYRHCLQSAALSTGAVSTGAALKGAARTDRDKTHA